MLAYMDARRQHFRQRCKRDLGPMRFVIIRDVSLSERQKQQPMIIIILQVGDKKAKH